MKKVILLIVVGVMLSIPVFADDAVIAAIVADSATSQGNNGIGQNITINGPDACLEICMRDTPCQQYKASTIYVKKDEERYAKEIVYLDGKQDPALVFPSAMIDYIGQCK